MWRLGKTRLKTQTTLWKNWQILDPPFLFSQRSVLAFLAFLGNIFVYTVRVNISVAIICMVRTHVATVNTTLSNVSDVRNATASNDACGGDDTSSSSGAMDERGEFDWDKSTRSELLAMYFYGYIFTQIPGGWLASRFGGRRVWGVCMFVCALCTILTPVSARANVYVAYAIRFILGFAAGVTFPAVHALLGRWAPTYERSKMASFTFAGPLLGNIATFSISGVLCEYGFDNGWGSIFYISGIGNMLWVVAWFLLTADSPAQHKRISEKERVFIEWSIGKGSIKKVTYVPWIKMFTSGPLWASITAHMCNNYVNYTLLTSLPTFMKESLNFDIKQNGVLSALPYLCQLVSSIAAGYLADTARERGWLSTTMVRKIWQVTCKIITLFVYLVEWRGETQEMAFVGTAACIAGTGLMNCDQRMAAVAMLCLCTSFMGLNRAGYCVNHLDLAPSYAGVLFGITNTAATIPGMIAPIIAGALTPNRTAEEWRNVFYVCCAVAAVGALLFLILADGELQPWAVPPESIQELEVRTPINAANHPENGKSPAADGADGSGKGDGPATTIAIIATADGRDGDVTLKA